MPKTHPRIAAIGDVDELNCVVGLLLTETLPDDIRAALAETQHELFDLGGELSIPGYTAIGDVQIARIEAWAAELNTGLPMLKDFILPGGSRAAAYAHLVRTVSRRAERTVLQLAATDTVSEAARIYLNRLSDLAFVLARVLNRAAGRPDVIWQKDRHKPSDGA